MEGAYHGTKPLTSLREFMAEDAHHGRKGIVQQVHRKVTGSITSSGKLETHHSPSQVNRLRQGEVESLPLKRTTFTKVPQSWTFHIQAVEC
jgi:hypothetical protein